ncbi:hypothetical protein FE257_005789 [Aspergillus nanangensis]|uniref:Uncharacterized protein n=1 Tax=Aspergillus nanangensis TaxID=2582783 RepID=A0AAD4CRW0_ASPNN|nr:hypothetical protein FE257_005789 [Aspergillus nanangensis]
MTIILENESPPASLADTAAMEAACQWFIYTIKRPWANVLNIARILGLRALGLGIDMEK